MNYGDYGASLEDKTGNAYFNETISACPATGEIRATQFTGNLSGKASSADVVAWTGVTGKPNYYDAKAIKGISRSGTTFTYTCMDGSTGTFT